MVVTEKEKGDSEQGEMDGEAEEEEQERKSRASSTDEDGDPKEAGKEEQQQQHDDDEQEGKSASASADDDGDDDDEDININNLDETKQFHAIRACHSMIGSAVFTDWDDCQMMIEKKEKDDATPFHYECASFDDWDEAYLFVYPDAAPSAPPTTKQKPAASPVAKMDGGVDGRTSTKRSKGTPTAKSASSTAGSSSTSSKRKSTRSNRKRSIGQVSTAATQKDEWEEEQEDDADPTRKPAKTYPPEGPIIDPDKTDLPVMIRGSAGQAPKKTLNDWHLGRKLAVFNRHFDERMVETSNYLEENNGHIFVGRRNKQNKEHSQYKPLLNWIDNTLRPQLKVYTTLKETGGSVPAEMLPKLHGYSRFILFLKRSHVERMKGVGIYDSLMMEGKERRAIAKAMIEAKKEPQVWDEMYAKLKEFKEKWGHVVVRRQECLKEKLPGHSKLVLWVDKQKQEYRKLQGGDSESTMTNDRIIKLIALGMTLDSKSTQSHEERAREWLIYKATHNGEDPPPSKTKNNGLHLWIVKTRQKYAKLKAGESTTLSQEQADQLEQWGFDFEIKKPRACSNNGKGPSSKRSFDVRLQDYVAFKELHGTAWITKNSCALGQWCADQRKNYNLYQAHKAKNGENGGKYGGTMTAERIAKLEAVGFPWEKPPDQDVIYDSRSAKRLKQFQQQQQAMIDAEPTGALETPQAGAELAAASMIPKASAGTIPGAEANTSGSGKGHTKTTSANEGVPAAAAVVEGGTAGRLVHVGDEDLPSPPPLGAAGYPQPPGVVVNASNMQQQYQHALNPTQPPPLHSPPQQPYHVGEGQYQHNDDGATGQQQQQQQQFPRFGQYPWGFGSN